MRCLRLLSILCAVLAAPGAFAARLEIPLRLPYETIGRALGAHLGAGSGAPLVREGPCRYLHMEMPKLEALDAQVRVRGPGSGALGVELLGACQNAVAWRGAVEMMLLPQLDAGGRLRLRVVDSRLTDSAGGNLGLRLLWDMGRRQVHPRLEQFSYDIGALRTELAAVLRHVAPPQVRGELEAALARLELLEPRVEADAVVVPLALEIPDAWVAAPAPPAPAAPLTEAELAALEQALQPWDAFLVYSLKQVALDTPDEALRQRLFTLLLDSRYRLAAILSGDERVEGDPLRALFVEAWEELRAILTQAQRAGLLDASVLRYALFVDAGDALLALDRAAPGLGLQLTADGLRQLARSLQPAATDDPLRFDWALDPQLRSLFHVAGIVELGPPPPAPAPVPTKSWLDFFLRSAHAEGAGAPRALDRWIPVRAELAAYEARVGELLLKTAASELERAKLAAPYDAIYRHLMPTTALIESCWRQYTVRGGKVTYLRSGAGSVGIMQINQHVWRGFYDVERLRWDTAYNTRAGAQILMRYVRDYAIPYAKRSGELDDVPRAAYAVYNAGPRAVGRFAKPKPHPREARVDGKLWSLYQDIAAGGRVDLATCGVQPSAAAGRSG